MAFNSISVLSVIALVLLVFVLGMVLCMTHSRQPPQRCCVGMESPSHLVMASTPNEGVHYDPLGPLQPATGPAYYLGAAAMHDDPLGPLQPVTKSAGYVGYVSHTDSIPLPPTLTVQDQLLASPYETSFSVDYGSRERNEAVFQHNQFESAKAKLGTLQTRSTSTQKQRRKRRQQWQDLSPASTSTRDLPRDLWRMQNCVGGCKQVCKGSDLAPDGESMRRCLADCQPGCELAL
jgi:hypothetical protein